MMETCPHGRDKDDCLICWSTFNLEIEKLRIESGLFRSEFEKVIKDCIRKEIESRC